MANIVVCADGTWNTPDDKEDEIPAPTNVVKLYNSLDSQDENGTDQKKYYHPGVGSDGTWWQRIGGGGVGLGLGDNVKSAYKWLAVNYRPEDKIFLFGFSRGAYTVRSLGGMIGSCGLLDLSSSELTDDDIWQAVDDMFNSYRGGKKTPAAPKGTTFHNPDSRKRGARTTKIHFIGVWDTVGALGIPDDLALLNLIDDPRRHSFHDTELSDMVVNARHAVAIDEERQSFAPTLWTKVESRRRTVKQVWFPGVHSDVGGGYAVAGLSDGALDWMMEEASALGLRFRAGARAQLHPDPRSLLHNSLTGVFAKLKSRPRNVPQFKTSSADLHQSATDRHDNPPLHEAAYWPSRVLRKKNDSVTLDIFARQHWNATGLYLEAGKRYSFTASGQWLDSDIKCGPRGTKDGKFEPKEAFHILSSGLGKLENLYGRITGNDDADFWWTKRVEKLDWFVLVGVIANGIGADSTGTLVDHETFKIGEDADHTAQQSGYLYCFANDAWQKYENNRGSVRLTVKRL